MGTPKQTDLKVGENTFLFVKLPALQASELLWELAGKVAPALMDALGVMRPNASLGQVAMNARAVVGIGQALQNLDRKAFMAVAQELLASTTYGNKPAFPQLNAVLDGPEEFFLLVWKALEFQYGPLFGAVVKVGTPSATAA